MHVLIVEENPSLSDLWTRHLERQGASVTQARSQERAVAALREREVDVIVLDLILSDGSALAVADFANYRRPAARVVFVTGSTFFSDGSIFNLVPNACAFIQTWTPPDDLASIVAHYGS